jgi:hypothetical protein
VGGKPHQIGAASAWYVALLVSFFLGSTSSVFAESEPEVPAEDAGGDDLDQKGGKTKIVGYETGNRDVGTPIDVNSDLKNSFRQPGALFSILQVPNTSIANGKNWLYNTIGLKLSLSYQMGYFGTSVGVSAFNGWLLFESSWELIDRGGDFQGGVTAVVDWRHNVAAGTAVDLFQGTGSLWIPEILFIPWDPYPTMLYWEQWFKKGFLVVRAGQQNPANILDFFRFKDSRVSFSGSAFANNAAAIPVGAPGLGLSFEMWPIEDSELYLVGVVSDLNAPVGRLDWSTIENGEFFYGLEVGYNWKRRPGDFDHVHLLAFYSDSRTTAPVGLPNEAGWGMKLRGTKQWDQLVASASYTYNTVEGGGLGFTNTRHDVSAVFALVRPFDVQGEVALGLAFSDPINENLRDQYGLETYWRLLVTPNLWVTPGMMTLFNPSLNPTNDVVVIGQVKFRVFI